MTEPEAPQYLTGGEPPELPSAFVPNPISEIEDFFGEPLSAKLIDDTIARLPHEQLKLVGNRCTKVSGMVELFIGTRGIDGSKISAGYEAFEPLHDQEIHLHDGLIQAGVTTAVTEVPGLKQLLLYCDRMLARNTLLAPLRLPEPDAARTFAARLRELLPLAGLIRSGHVILATNEGILAPGYDIYQLTMTRSDPFIDELLEPYPELRNRIRHYYDEPYEAPPVPDNPPLLPGERALLSEALAGPQRIRKIASMLATIYPIPVSPDELARVMGYAGRARAGQLRPFVSDRLLAYHLAQGMRAALGSDRLQEPLPSDFSLPVKFQVPTLGGLSLEEVVNVRTNEAVFSEMQTALTSLAEAGGQDTTRFDTYEAYESEMRRLARDIVEPVHARLLAWQRRIEHRRWAGKGLGMVAQLGLGLTPIPLLGDAVGKGIERTVDRSTDRRRQDLQTAGRIMKALL